MSTLAHTVSDSATMLRRDLRHLRRYPVMTISGVMVPTSMLLLFVYVFGGAKPAALGASGGGTSYVNYIVPGIIVIAVGSGCASTAVSVNADMTEGIIARFRTMAISRASVLTGHVVGNVVRTMASIVLVLGVALLIGFRPTAGPVEWIAAIGVITMLVLAFTWLAVALGMSAKSPEGANGSTLLLQFGPFLSSAFVRFDAGRDGMVRREHALHPRDRVAARAAAGRPMGNSAVIAVACASPSRWPGTCGRGRRNRDPVR